MARDVLTATNGSSALRSGPRVSPPRGRRRRPGLAVVLVLAATVGALLAVSLYSAAGAKDDVLALARDVAPGQVLATGDLRVVTVSADPSLRPVGADQLTQVVGKPARANLAAGTLLSAAQLGEPLAARPGEAVVGLALKAGRYPGALRVGDKVVVVVSAPPSATGIEAALGNAVGEARVLAVSRPAEGSSGGGGTLISIVVPGQIGPEVAGASAADRVSLVQVPAA